jgi:hypothetical protein
MKKRFYKRFYNKGSENVQEIRLKKLANFLQTAKV